MPVWNTRSCFKKAELGMRNESGGARYRLAPRLRLLRHIRKCTRCRRNAPCRTYEALVAEGGRLPLPDRIVLNELEYRALAAYLEGKSYEEMAGSLGRSMKVIDNALQRIRRKFERVPRRGGRRPLTAFVVEHLLCSNCGLALLHMGDTELRCPRCGMVG